MIYHFQPPFFPFETSYYPKGYAFRITNNFKLASPLILITRDEVKEGYRRN